MSHETILAELEEYCERVGLKPSTVCVRALNDSRYVKRHHRRLEVLDRDAEKLRQYMVNHPPGDTEVETEAA